MTVTIDNLSGGGPVDYTGSVDAANSVVIKRKLNAPAECEFGILPDAQGLPLPSRYARVSVADAAGVVLFTGYVAAPPSMVVLGRDSPGQSYVAQVSAVSDELLLDSVLSTKTGNALNQPASAALQTLAVLSGATVTLSASSNTALVGRFSAQAGTKWSVGAGALASAARSAYRVLGGVTSLTSIGSTVHTLSESDGSLQVSALSVSAIKLLANDVTICGNVEPAAYVSETFVGDGLTKEFALTQAPFKPHTSETLNFNDLFQGAVLNDQVWQWSDGGSRLSINANGVSCSGGTGRDGETVVSAVHQVELGGSVVLEAGGTQIAGQGLLLGLYTGPAGASTCFVAFQVSQVSGATQVAALVNGVVGGSSFQPAQGHRYTLRIRIYSPEMERVQQSYYYLDAGGVNSYGGGLVVAPGHIVLEVQDVTSGAPGLPVVLYDGTTTTLPTNCTIGLLDSGALTCSIKSFTCTQGAPIWVTVAPPQGTPGSQYLGSTAEGGSCKVDSGGKLNFYNGTIPAAGALIQVSYRTKHRAVARRSISQDSPIQQSTTATPATQMWMGTVRAPAAWSSVDCDNAAAALLKSSAAASAAWSGNYTGWNLEASGDIWPGDLVALSSVSAGLSANVVVRQVDIAMGCAFPQLVKYDIRFANDWAEDLAIKLSSSVPEDAWLPALPNLGGSPLMSLAALQVQAITGTQISIKAGASAPAGGGFEVKRKDWTFGPGADSDLVLRSPVSNFIIPRLAAMEQYYIRMYDGSTPPNYSQMSAAVFVNVPLGGS